MPRERGAGRSSSVFIWVRASSTATKLSVLTKNAGPVPTAAMTSPATPGPRIRAALNEALLRLTALASEVRGTISETNVWRAGLSMAVARPCSSASR